MLTTADLQAGRQVPTVRSGSLRSRRPRLESLTCCSNTLVAAAAVSTEMTNPLWKDFYMGK